MKTETDEEPAWTTSTSGAFAMYFLRAANTGFAYTAGIFWKMRAHPEIDPEASRRVEYTSDREAHLVSRFFLDGVELSCEVVNIILHW